MTNPLGNIQPRPPLLHFGHPEARIPGYEVPDFAAPPVTKRRLLLGTLLAIGVALLGFWMHHYASEANGKPQVGAFWMIPFVLLLGSIATMPFIARHWWEHHYAKVALVLGVVVAGFYLFGVRQFDSLGHRLGTRAIAESMAEYISFIILLGSLFIVSGGILIRIRAKATPIANTSLLLIGAVIANLFGTTGASMLLIRPFLRMNRNHIRPYHVVFFIFIVSNVGGALTPIGDPPLFLGFLQGVPFWWVLENCWPIWLLVNGGLLAIFFIIDTLRARKGERASDAFDFGPALSLFGAANLIWIALIIAGILLHSPINHAIHNLLGFELPVRELAMIFAATASLAFTPYRVHAENHFNYAPIKEVAFLFVGIFLTMVPALNYLYHESSKPEAERRIVIHTPGQFYFASGGLSSVLDNAPTYLTFLQTKLGQLDAVTVNRVMAIAKRPGSDVTETDLAGLSDEQQQSVRQTVAALLKYHKDRVDQGNLSEGEVRVGFLVGDERLNLNLVAVSMGAVLFGAMTYIGNGPNFMVKSIADHAGVATPSFFGYVFKYAVPCLFPLLIVVWVVFLR